VVVQVGVAYGSDVEQVHAVLLAAAQSVPSVVDEPVPYVRFVEMGDSALLFRVQAWIDEPVLRGQCIDGLNTAIYQALGREKIEIPFPQRVVHAAPRPARDD
jgi:small-conductance mechanosensitive channel